MEAWVWGWIAAALAVGAAFAVWRTSGVRGAGPLVGPDVDERVGRWLLGAVVAFGVALHAPGLAGAFNTFDDPRQILNDPVITELTPLHVGLILDNYRGTSQELMYLSFQLNWFVAGDAYWAWYLPNLVVFAGILFLVHRLAWHLLGHRLGAALAAGIFAAAPITAELLCWMSARSHLLGLTFALASVVAWFESTSPGRSRARWLAASLVAFALSQGCKPIFLYVPAWLVLFDLYRGRRAWAEKLPYVGLVALFLAKALRGATDHGRIGDQMLGGSYAATLLTDLNFVVEYGRSLLIPYETGLLPHKNAATGWWAVEGVATVLPVGFAPAASLVILAAVAAIAGGLSRRWAWHLPMLVLVAFAVSLVTVLNVPWRGAAAAFEYRYTLSGHVLAAILFADAAQRARAAWSGEIARVGLGAAVGAYLVASADATLDNVHAWRAPAPYWVRNTMLYPGDYDAHYNAGKALARKRQHHAALDHLEIAEPNHPDSAVYRRLAESYDALGLLGEARANYLRYYSRNRSAVVGDVKERFAELGITDDMVRAARKIPVERDPWAVLTQEGLGAAGETGETEADAGAPPR